MTVSLLRRFEHAQHQLALATLPTAGVLDYAMPDVTETIDPSLLTGPGWRQAQRLRLETVKGGC